MPYLKFLGIFLLIGMALTALVYLGLLIAWRIKVWRRNREIQARINRRFWG